MNAKKVIKTSAYYAMGTATRMRALVDREPRFSGAYPTLELARASLAEDHKAGYDSDDMVEVSQALMSEMLCGDYPVVFWLDRLIRDNGTLSLLDAGGHVGLKHAAFAPYLDVDKLNWSVWDLPALLRAGRKAQGRGEVSKSVSFVESPADAGETDILLASGLMQYLDTSFAELTETMANRPRWVVLNKVATRENDTVVTLEMIGNKRVPYQMRNRTGFETELHEAGYEIRDSWALPHLSHRIGTHPWLGQSASKGYFLERI